MTISSRSPVRSAQRSRCLTSLPDEALRQVTGGTEADCEPAPDPAPAPAPAPTFNVEMYVEKMAFKLNYSNSP